jgi:hypothetical protein
MASSDNPLAFQVQCPDFEATNPLVGVFCLQPQPEARESDVRATGMGCYQIAPPSGGVYFYCCGAFSSQ